MAVSEIVPPAAGDDNGTSRWLARLMQEEGVDLLSLTEAARRGTPVYVDASADVVAVQQAMARHHIRLLPVLDHEGFFGVIDLVSLAERDDLVPGTAVAGYVDDEGASAAEAVAMALASPPEDTPRPV